MGALAVAPEAQECRVVFVQPDSHGVLSLAAGGSFRLPRVTIPSMLRPAQELQKAIKATWGISAFILDMYVEPYGTSPCAVVELLSPQVVPDLEAVALDRIMSSELTGKERHWCDLLLESGSTTPVARIGWIHEALDWVASATGRRFSVNNEIEQMNACGAFTLVRFRADTGTDYWLKATGEPNAHELAVTALLSRICKEYLPELIDTRPDWNAWLMAGQSSAIYELPSEPLVLLNLLKVAIESMAELQMRTAGRDQDLLEAGAFDHRLHTLMAHSGEVFAYMEEAMSAQTSVSARRIDRPRMEKLREIFDRICERLDALELPNMVVHGDMNPSNILSGCGHCRFIDWCEAYVGNPMITFEHLLLLNQVSHPDRKKWINQILRSRYRAKLSKVCDGEAIDKGFLYSPILAAFSALHGRCDWLATPLRNDPRRQAYARNLARFIDLAASEPALLGALGI